MSGVVWVCFRGDEPDGEEHRMKVEAEGRRDVLNARDGDGWRVERYVLRGRQT